MRAIIFALCSLLTTSVMANTYQVGDQIADITLQDQHQVDYHVDSKTTRVLFSRSMDGGTLIQEALEAEPELVSDTGLMYVADISGMPSLIARFVALPQFKKFPYRVALDNEGEQTKPLPAEKDQATLIELNNNQITKITFFASTTDLLAALK
ncbi:MULTISPECIES: hypothetical protein [Shewanella]|uniref:FAD/FMN-containing dehydrogenase n=1 Tax=Shewanella fidelis TaxID=173509 RepID=A0AAW8NRD6_9GAMM|nr:MULTISPECIES: hypothetical protein [Shewanella]MDR8525346.1 hypothetical protein [Shewanella fidelis]MDW4813617.1 hypothetical protein [Shewanella fidelis]MDW4817725.1 hypothetical protein [Shewanella fidelis]MDW4821792.1 hypothetical protein [Shewanella fidelis]MDW4825945.1 hypothetical protein [Shewanella fidelis]